MQRFWNILVAAWLVSVQAWAVPQGRTRAKKAPTPVDDDQTHKLWHWIEDHLEIVFPLVGVTVIVLVLWAVRRGMAQADDAVAVRQRQKEAITRLMRLKLNVTAETVATELKLDRFHAAALLEELGKEGVLVARVLGGVSSYRLKGL